MPEATYTIKVRPAIRPNQNAPSFILSGLENLQGWRLSKFSRQTALLLDCPHGEKDFPKSTLNLCCFNLPHCLLSSHHISLWKAWLCLLDHFIICVGMWLLCSPEAFSSPGWTGSCSLSPFSQARIAASNHLAGPLLNSLLLIDVLLYCEAQNPM